MGEIRTYRITVDGYGGGLYCARSPSKARARAYQSFLSCRDATFREFLKISRIERVPNPRGVGDRIIVSGLPATRVVHGPGQYVAFMRDGSDEILFSHPADVSEPTP